MIRPHLPRWRVAMRLWPRGAEGYEVVEWVTAASRAAAREAAVAPIRRNVSFLAFLVREIDEVQPADELRERQALAAARKAG